MAIVSERSYGRLLIMRYGSMGGNHEYNKEETQAMDHTIQYLGLEVKDWAVMLSTVLGPILAVQAQKMVEQFRERRQRKIRLFEQLMATRAARLSPEHVRALNMIDLVFYGEKTLGILRRSAKEQNILDAWKEYHDHLNTRAEEGQLSLWAARGDEIFTNILFSIAQDIGYTFDRVQLKRGAYSPIAHGELEAQQEQIRKAALSLLTGEHALKMNVVGFPIDPEALAANKAAIQNVGKALETGTLNVQIVGERDER